MINREDLWSGTRPEVGSRVLITVMEHFQGYEIVDYKGMVWGISMRVKDIAQDFFMGCKQITGGELTSFTELSDEARQRAVDRMIAMAQRIGANAIINFKFEQTLPGATGDSEVTAFGNAVVIKPIKNYVPTGGLGNILCEFVDAYTLSHGVVESNSTAEKMHQVSEGKLIKENDMVLVECPYCAQKYHVERSIQTGEVRVKGFQDVDLQTPGQQIECAKCHRHFTVPQI